MSRQNSFSGVSWRFIEAAAALLSPREREVVLGDLAETNCGAWRGVGEVLDLALRRHFALWKSWRPWAACFGLALPASLFLMGRSVEASRVIAILLEEPAQTRLLWLSLSGLLLVIPWVWMAGFVVGAVSRGTLWASVLACCVPFLYCLSKWPGHGISGLQLFVFALPGLWGVLRGRTDSRLGLGWTMFLATTATLAPMLWGKGGWMHGCWLLWPGCYLAATAWGKQA
jgi:hypothetical protein